MTDWCAPPVTPPPGWSQGEQAWLAEREQIIRDQEQRQEAEQKLEDDYAEFASRCSVSWFWWRSSTDDDLMCEERYAYSNDWMGFVDEDTHEHAKAVVARNDDGTWWTGLWTGRLGGKGKYYENAGDGFASLESAKQYVEVQVRLDRR